MTSFTLSPVPEILFGPGRLADIADKAKALAGPGAAILMVADPVLKSLGITALALDLLEKAGFETHV